MLSNNQTKCYVGRVAKSYGIANLLLTSLYPVVMFEQGEKVLMRKRKR